MSLFSFFHLSPGGSVANLIASAIVSPIYVVVTNPLSRLEVIMQTNSIKGNSISVFAAIKEITTDMATFGLKGVFRGQGIGIAKAIVSLSLFHEGRMWLSGMTKSYNISTGAYTPPPKAWVGKRRLYSISIFYLQDALYYMK